MTGHESPGREAARPWAPDALVTVDLARRLIAGQFPHLLPLTIREAGFGWDNTAFRVNETLCFRFPRRELAEALLINEKAALPLLAPHLPLPIPVPVLDGVPAEGYRYPFQGSAWIEGSPADASAVPAHVRAACGPPLGRFLRALHSVPVTDAVRAWAPHDDIRRADLPFRLPGLEARLKRLEQGGEPELFCSAANLARELSGAPGHAAGCWVHGDLYPRHLMLSKETLSGIIDWGDVHVGDPALDLSIAYTFLPAAARPGFREAYGGVDDDAWARARFRSVNYGATFCEYGTDTGDEPMAAMGLMALRSALER